MLSRQALVLVRLYNITGIYSISLVKGVNFLQQHKDYFVLTCLVGSSSPFLCLCAQDSRNVFTHIFSLWAFF